MNDVDIRARGTIEIDGDRASVSFERRYDRQRSAVWQALTEPAQLAQWLDETVVDLRVGGRFEIHFSDATMTGTITDLETDRLLAYSWHEGRDDQSHVRWELTDDGDGTVVRLVHTRLKRSSAPGFSAGWHHHLERLAALLTGHSAPWDDARFTELMGEYEAPGS